MEWNMLRDFKNRIIIPREKLNPKPDLLKSEVAVEPTPDHSYDWTISNFTKAGIVTLSDCIRDKKPNNPNPNPNQMKRDNNMKKKLQIRELPPVHSSKAESMMQRMGWKGGALGKAENGILEPIAPNLANIQSTAGLGHNPDEKKKKKRHSKPEKAPKKRTACSADEYFIINSLLYIREFVKDDREIELVFDCKIIPFRRKLIHSIVNNIINSEEYVSFETSAESKVKEIYEDIVRRNKMILGTESEGTPPKRYLCLYKEAPDNVYLVTPDYFRDENEIKESSAEEIVKEKKIRVHTPKKTTEPVVQKNDNETAENIIKMNSRTTDEIEETNPSEGLNQHAIHDSNVTSIPDANNEINPTSDKTIVQNLTLDKIDKINTTIGKIDESNKKTAVNPTMDIINEMNASKDSIDERDKTTAASPNKEKINEMNARMLTTDNTNKLNPVIHKSNELNVNETNPLNYKTDLTDKDESDSVEKKINISKSTPKTPPNTESTEEEIEEFTNKLTEFFIEFLKGDQYNEFRFLGNYKCKEIQAITDFQNNLRCFDNEELKSHLDRGEEIEDVLNRGGKSLSVEEDCNGSVVVYKMDNILQYQMYY